MEHLCLSWLNLIWYCHVLQFEIIQKDNPEQVLRTAINPALISVPMSNAWSTVSKALLRSINRATQVDQWLSLYHPKPQESQLLCCAWLWSQIAHQIVYYTTPNDVSIEMQQQLKATVLWTQGKRFSSVDKVIQRTDAQLQSWLEAGCNRLFCKTLCLWHEVQTLSAQKLL